MNFTESVVQNNIVFEQYHTPAYEAPCIHGSDVSPHISPQEQVSFLYKIWHTNMLLNKLNRVTLKQQVLVFLYLLPFSLIQNHLIQAICSVLVVFAS